MEPTIHSSDIVLTEHISVTRQTIEVYVTLNMLLLTLIVLMLLNR